MLGVRAALGQETLVVPVDWDEVNRRLEAHDPPMLPTRAALDTGAPSPSGRGARGGSSLALVASAAAAAERELGAARKELVNHQVEASLVEALSSGGVSGAVGELEVRFVGVEHIAASVAAAQRKGLSRLSSGVREPVFRVTRRHDVSKTR